MGGTLPRKGLQIAVSIWRDAIEGGEVYQLLESPAHYKALLGFKKEDIGPENTYCWDVKDEQSTP